MSDNLSVGTEKPWTVEDVSEDGCYLDIGNGHQVWFQNVKNAKIVVEYHNAALSLMAKKDAVLVKVDRYFGYCSDPLAKEVFEALALTPSPATAAKENA